MPDDSPIADTWSDEDRVCLVIKSASIIEYQGELTPGLAMSPVQAIQLAEHILQHAREAMEYDG